jgi:pyruvate formate lyase activating enzyme
MDPIEKKPLYHFHPGSKILSIGTKGCNLQCPFCQNWHISRDMNAASTFRAPEYFVKAAAESGSASIAYTYSEPVIWYEYVLDTAEAAAAAGLKNVLVTNGFINTNPLNELLKSVHAMNIDLKCFSEELYRSALRGSLQPVLESIRTAKQAGRHVELTTLVVTGFNDDMKQMEGIISFIESVDPAMPWHISRYYPNYKYGEPPTDTAFIEKVRDAAQKRLRYVYTGNLPSGSPGSETLCPECGKLLISRRGYSVKITGMSGNKCAACGYNTGIIV